MLRGMCVVCGAVTHTHAQEHKQLCRRGRPSWQRPLIMALRVFALRKPFLGFPTGSLCSRARQAYSTVPYSRHNIEVSVRQGFPVLSLSLPSRNETCDFVLRPFLQTVAHVTHNIRNEDPGIERISFQTVEGHRMAGSTPLGLLLQSEFDLQINNIKYRVHPSSDVLLPSDSFKTFEELKSEVSKLYHQHNVHEHQLCKDLELRGQLEQLRSELAPLEKKYLEMAEKSDRHREIVTWAGLSWMSLQFGFLSYLVFWEYDWDIMEPVTYFVGSATSIILFTYFILTRQEYSEEGGHERYYLNYFHRRAKRNGFDVHRYNQLKEAIAGLRERMDRLHDPLLLNLPPPSPSPSPTFPHSQ